ncbi:MAG: hypothetical protein QOE41_4029 [Mycobacterium sp.]|jgi:hypothetical protein|nr:3-oxoacyl-ACP reductase [Mycobacterium sp.]MDT5134718.1 hypothetical protein [Mycobacterium sp.]
MTVCPKGIRSNVVVSGLIPAELYDGPGGFAEQATKIRGIDEESAFTRIVDRLLTRRLGQQGPGRPGSVG